MVKVSSQEIKDITLTLSELNGDNSVPRNVKLKIQNIIKTLEANTELSIKINKVLDELDEIADDVNLQPYTRTQIWNVVSNLEKLFQSQKDVKN